MQSRTDKLIAASIQWAERIMEKIDERSSRSGQGTTTVALDLPTPVPVPATIVPFATDSEYKRAR